MKSENMLWDYDHLSLDAASGWLCWEGWWDTDDLAGNFRTRTSEKKEIRYFWVADLNFGKTGYCGMPPSRFVSVVVDWVVTLSR